MVNPLFELQKRRRKKLRQKRKAEKRARRQARRAERMALRPPPVPFVVGVNRSGTTLLRMMLDSHPDLAIPPETHFIPALFKELKRGLKEQGRPLTAEEVADFLVAHRRWGDFGLERDELVARLHGVEIMRPKWILHAFYSLYAQKQGKSRYGDKTPGYVKQMGIVQRSLPEARFIHLIRDGRDVALSRESRITAEDMSVERHAKIWKRRISRARRQEPRLEHYLEVRYEDLVRDPESVLRKVCEFSDLSYDPAMLTYHERSGERLQEIARDLDDDDGGAIRPAEERIEAHSLVIDAPRQDRVERWRELMPPEEVATFEEIAGDLLEELGYELSTKS